jgi:hypothetical protein
MVRKCCVVSRGSRRLKRREERGGDEQKRRELCWPATTRGRRGQTTRFSWSQSHSYKGRVASSGWGGASDSPVRVYGFAPRCVVDRAVVEDVFGRLGCLTAGASEAACGRGPAREARRRGGLRQRASSAPRARGPALLGGTRSGDVLSSSYVVYPATLSPALLVLSPAVELGIHLVLGIIIQ